MALFGSKDDAGSCELLRHRAHVKDRRGCERDAEFEARVTEGPFVNEVAGADYAD
jgi:hypothetical protein